MESRSVLAVGVVVAPPLGGQTAAAAPPSAVPVMQPDPLLMFPSNRAGTDWARVARDRAATAWARGRRADARAAVPYREQEPPGVRGANDSPATAEHIAGFGTGRNATSKIAPIGDILPDDTVPTRPPSAEPDDALGLAGDLGLDAGRPSVRTGGTIGDGPHGSAGDGTGDFDFCRLGPGAAGRTITARTSTPTGELDPLLALWDADGGLWAVNGDVGGSTDSAVTTAIPPGRDLMVGSDPFGLPRDPRTPGTGEGVLSEGPYELLISSGRSGGDLAARGLNPRFAVQILNSRDHAGPWGQPNVSRVVVGGTVAETGIPTIGIAQSIDAGNFGREETALVLLDDLSAPAGPVWTLNTYVGPESDRIAFLGRAVGNIASHEAGHMSGSWHTDLTNSESPAAEEGSWPR
ncbi:hypothetical protein ACWEFJ_38855 [Actinosynnema sp. NPDC004786]